MNRRELIKVIFVSKLTFLLAISLISLVVFVFAARNNYQTMTELREKVKIADQKGGDVEKALRNLREHVYGHMNTDLTSGPNAISPPIQLKSRYESLAKKEADRVAEHNKGVEAQGEVICSAQFPAGGINPPRVACVQEYVAQNAITSNSVPEDLYKFDFISPRWSPDLAGYSLLVAIISGAGFVAGLGFQVLKRRYY